MNEPQQNMLTVGRRSDGLISLTSAPPGAGAGPASVFMMDAATAKWVALEILRLVEGATPTGRPADG